MTPQFQVRHRERTHRCEDWSGDPDVRLHDCVICGSVWAERDRYRQALVAIANHAKRFGPNTDTAMCDQSCADEMIGTAREALDG